jgi:succinyl-diaminopimelate desuccinylase
MSHAPPSNSDLDTDLARCVDLVRRLVRTPSLPGHEGELATLVRAEMESLDYDEVRIDDAGNVLGLVRGRGEAEAVLLHTHLDHVDVGDPARWPHPPFGAVVEGGKIWGRGTVDIKGPLAAQVIAGAQLVRGERPPGDVWVAATVQEEIGGAGARFLARDPPARLVVLGEPSRCQVRRGHRGRYELVVHVRGRSVHASVPAQGANPLFPLARFLERMAEVGLPEHPELGVATVAPTLVRTDQTSGNVVPGEVWLTLDHRAVPGEDVDELAASFDALLARCARELPVALAFSTEVAVDRSEMLTYTGLSIPGAGENPPFVLAASHPAVVAACAIVAETLGRDAGLDVWQFATDGGHFAAAGMTPIGFGPGDDRLAHTVDEHVEISALREAIVVNERLARELTARVGSGVLVQTTSSARSGTSLRRGSPTM